MMNLRGYKRDVNGAAAPVCVTARDMGDQTAKQKAFTKVLVQLAYLFEYLFESVAKAAEVLSTSAATGMTAHPSMAAAAFTGGGVTSAVLVYVVVRGIKRVMSGIMMIAMGLLLMTGSFSLLLVSYAPPTVDVVNATNATIAAANLTASLFLSAASSSS